MNVLLAVPEQNNSIQELKHFLSEDKADLYVFPEGFLDSIVLREAIDIIRKEGKYVITGYKDFNQNGQQKALVIDGGNLVDEYTKCILTKGESRKRKGKEKKSVA